MKIYTKTGDKGQTSLIGGTRVPKHHIRIEAYGTIDELNSWIGLLRDQQINEKSIKALLEIQDRLFTIGSLLAADPEKSRMKLPSIDSDDITFLESEIDEMNATIPELKSFILPGGHPVVSYCHITRCVCRRAERLVVHLNEESTIDDKIIIYINRLSDYLFTLARFLANRISAVEIPWNPRQ
jgi:cob(I)alamin adenosyltransferase